MMWFLLALVAFMVYAIVLGLADVQSIDWERDEAEAAEFLRVLREAGER